jgi:Domain of unknown function (DUF4253)
LFHAQRRLCTCGEPLQLAVKPLENDPSEAGSSAAAAAPGASKQMDARAFASAIAVQVGCDVVKYSTVDFGRERKAGQRALLIDRKGQPEGERGVALVRHLRSMGLPSGVQIFANALRNLSDDPERKGRDEVVVIDSNDPFDVIRVAEVDSVNCGLNSDDVVARLESWHQRFGIEIVAADTETVFLRFLRLPADVSELTAEIVEFCPEWEETFELESQALAESSWLWLWWD